MYKTMILELLQQQPEYYQQLSREQKLLPRIEQLARDLKQMHESWKATLIQAKPSSSSHQIASEALELALHDMTESLSTNSTTDATQPLSLDAAMAYLQHLTPPG